MATTCCTSCRSKSNRADLAAAATAKWFFMWRSFYCRGRILCTCSYAFLGYGLPVSADSQQYMQHILAVPAVQQWIEEAQAEFRFVTCEEPYRKLT